MLTIIVAVVAAAALQQYHSV